MYKKNIAKLRESDRYIAVVIFIFFLSFYSLTSRGLISEADGIINFMTTRSIAEDLSFSIPCDYPSVFIVQGLGNKCYSKYGVGQPLLSAPLYLAGRYISGPAPKKPDVLSFPRLVVSTFNQIITSATCSVLYMLGLIFTKNKRRSIEMVFVFGLLTIAWPYASTYFSQPAIGFLIILTVVLIHSQKHSHIHNLAAGAALGMAFLIRLDSLPLILIIFIWIIYETKISTIEFDKEFILKITVVLIPILASFIFFAIIQLHRYGSFFQTGYEGEGFSSSFLTGLFGLLFSFGKGILFYSPLILFILPGLVILSRQGYKNLPLLAFLLFFSQLAIFSSWWSWEGGWAWGPRFLVPSLPLLMIGLLPWLDNKTFFIKKAFPLFVFISFLVQVTGATTDPLQYYFNYRVTENQLLYNPVVSPIWIQFQYMISGDVSLLIPSNAHGILTPTQTVFWASSVLLLLLLSTKELMLITKLKTSELN